LADFLNSSSLKPFGQMNRNLVGSIFVRFSVNIAHFVPNQKQESSVVAMFDNRSGRNEQSLQRNFHRCFLPSFGSFGQAVSEEKILKKSANQKQELPVAAMFVNGSGQNEQMLPTKFQFIWPGNFRGEEF
jgi:hypothetical protein